LAKLFWMCNIIAASYFCYSFMHQAYKEAQLNPIISTTTSKHFSEFPFPQVTIVPDEQTSFLMSAIERHLNQFQFDCSRLTKDASKDECMECSLFIQRYLSGTLLTKLKRLFAAIFKFEAEKIDNVKPNLCGLHNNGQIQVLAKLIELYDFESLSLELGKQAAISTLRADSYSEVLNALEERTSHLKSNFTSCDDFTYHTSSDKLVLIFTMRWLLDQQRPPLPLGTIVTSFRVANKELVSLINGMNLTTRGMALHDIYGLVNNNKYCCTFGNVCSLCRAEKDKNVQLWKRTSMKLDDAVSVMKHGMTEIAQGFLDDPLHMNDEFKFLKQQCMLDKQDTLKSHLVWACQLNGLPLESCFEFEAVAVDIGIGYKLLSNKEYTVSVGNISYPMLRANDAITLFLYEKDANFK